jgi:predicted ATPase
VGRERELAEVMALLDTTDARLLTLTGAGGTGTTRRAIRLGRETASRPPLANAIGSPQSDAYVLIEQRHLSAVRARSAPTRMRHLEREGRALTCEQAIEVALEVARQAVGGNIVDGAGEVVLAPLRGREPRLPVRAYAGVDTLRSA